MSTDDVKKYFKNYATDNSQEVATGGEKKELVIKWINDSSCVVLLPTESMARKAYNNLKLSSQRYDDAMPPLTLYLEDLNEMKRKEFEKKQMNPDVDVLFE